MGRDKETNQTDEHITDEYISEIKSSDRNIAFGFAGVCIVIICLFYSKQLLDLIDLLALISLSISIPSMVAAGFIRTLEIEERLITDKSQTLGQLCANIGFVSGGVGFVLLFLSFSIIVGLIFAITSGFGTLMVLKVWRSISDAKTSSEKNKKE